MTESLQKIYERNIRGDWPDKGSTHSFIEYYETLLAPYRHTAKNILEIGLMSGESLRMWTEYFAFDAKGNIRMVQVIGMDCDIKPINGLADLTQTIKDGYNVVIGDASKPMDIARFFTGIKFDVVIEDAGHGQEQQVNIYTAIKPYMNKGGIYIIEDIQDIDYNRRSFETIDSTKTVEIIDRRKIKNRYDDVLVIIK